MDKLIWISSIFPAKTLVL